MISRLRYACVSTSTLQTSNSTSTTANSSSIEFEAIFRLVVRLSSHYKAIPAKQANAAALNGCLGRKSSGLPAPRFTSYGT